MWDMLKVQPMFTARINLIGQFNLHVIFIFLSFSMFFVLFYLFRAGLAWQTVGIYQSAISILSELTSSLIAASPYT